MLKRLLLVATALLAPAAASAKWHEASSAHFVVYSDQDPEQLRAFATKLERFDQALRYTRGMPDEPVGLANRLTVYVVPSIGAVQRLAGSGISNVAGFYVGRASGSVAFVPRRSGSGDVGDLDADTIFFHEYAHHFMLGNFSGAYPAWFTEGFAEYYSTAKVGVDGTVGFGYAANHRAYGIFNNQSLTLARMLGGAYDKLSDVQREVLYGRGWLLMHYLEFEPTRSGQLANYLRLLDEGRPAGHAATTAFGDIKALDRELGRYLRRPSLTGRTISLGKTPLGAITVRPLRPGEVALMPVRMRSDRGVDLKAARALVPDARRLAAPYPADSAVQASLAEVEYDARNLDQALAAADRGLAADPKHGKALIYKGRVLVARAVRDKTTDKAAWREARRWFVEASRVDTENAEPKMLFHASFLAEGAKPTPNAVEALVYAQILAPQDTGLRMQVVHQHLMDGKLDDARRVLGPVAYNPHGGPGRDRAAALMEKLVAKDKDGALALWDQRAAGEVEGN